MRKTVAASSTQAGQIGRDEPPVARTPTQTILPRR